MQKIAAKNKTFFYLATFVTALFLALTVMPKANAQGLEDDITPPDDVENLQIEVYDGAVVLSWDVATDDTKVTGYKIYSGPEAVTPESGEYSYDVIDAGDTIEYLVDGLENGKEIFVHRSEIPEGTYLNEGDPVEYEIENTDRGPQAKKVKKL